MIDLDAATPAERSPSLTRSTRPKTNRGPTGSDPPDDGPTVVAVVTHWHGHKRDIHLKGDQAHWMGDDGHLVEGSWLRPDVAPWEHRDGITHRHSSGDWGEHENGHMPHGHDPLTPPDETGTGNWISLPWPDEDGLNVDNLGEQAPTAPEAETIQAVETDTVDHDAAEVEASQTRHPSGREPADDGLPADPTERAALADQYRHALVEIDGSAPTPPAVPVREGMSRPGTSIAHPGALSLLNTVHKIKDDGLNHEMTWLSILLPLAVEIATYHADNRDEGGTGPELAPMELLMRTRDAMEHIVLPRLAREARS